MRFWALISALVPLLGGVTDRDRAGDPPPATSHGHTVAGDHYYIWDEDPAEAEGWAAELTGSPRTDLG